MKLNKFFSFIAFALGACLFVACGDDEIPVTHESEIAAKAVAGTYTGWTRLQSNMVNKDYANDTLTLALASDKTLTAIFKNKTWGVATIKGIKPAMVTEGYVFGGGDGTFEMNDVRQGGTQEFPCSVDSAFVSSDLKNLKVFIKANMSVAGGHGEMQFAFQTGDMPTE